MLFRNKPDRKRINAAKAALRESIRKKRMEDRAPQVTIIVAYNPKFVIGDKNNGIPWKIKEDMAFFKETTTGHSVIMGRKTWESIPDKFRPLPKRVNAVITTDADYRMRLGADHEGVLGFSGLGTAILFFRQYYPMREIFITGGGQIYDYALSNNLVHRVLASEIKGYEDVEGGVYFHNLKASGWTGKTVKEFADFNVVEYTR